MPSSYECEGFDEQSVARLTVDNMANTVVHFVCQYCSQPLQLDETFADADADSMESSFVQSNNNSGEFGAYSDERLQPPGSMTSITSNTSAVSQDSNEFVNEHEIVDGIRKVQINDRRPSLLEGAAMQRRMSGPPDELKGSEIGSDGVVRMRVRPRAKSATANSGDGFVILPSEPEQRALSKGSVGHQILIANRLFDIMSGETDIDFPLCSDCTDYVVGELEANISETEALTHEYNTFLESRQNTDVDQPVEQDESAKLELKELQQEQNELIAQLQAIEDARAHCRDELTQLKSEEDRLHLEEQRLWLSVNEFQRQYDLFLAQRESMDMRYTHATEQIARLKKTNIFNDTFHIWANGPFGTVNSFRLGRLSDVQVPWDEINAAWGQAVLLLHTMALRLSVTFQRVRPVPMGNHSYMERLDSKQQLELWLSGGFQPFQSSRYDQAMTAYLFCLSQFRDSIELRDPRFNLPYSINEDRIQGVSIKRGSSTDEEWTRACKYMLTDLKWCLTWMVKVQRD